MRSCMSKQSKFIEFIDCLEIQTNKGNVTCSNLHKQDKQRYCFASENQAILNTAYFESTHFW